MVCLQGLPRGHLQEVALRTLVFLAGATLGLLALLPLPWWGWGSDGLVSALVERGVPFVLDRGGGGYAAMLASVAPGLKDRQEVLTAGELWRYCGDPRPLLAYRDWFLSPEESLVHRLVRCRGRWREAHGTAALTLFLLPPPKR
jgi:hypothetical protein